MPLPSSTHITLPAPGAWCRLLLLSVLDCGDSPGQALQGLAHTMHPQLPTTAMTPSCMSIFSQACFASSPFVCATAMLQWSSLWLSSFEAPLGFVGQICIGTSCWPMQKQTASGTPGWQGSSPKHNCAAVPAAPRPSSWTPYPWPPHLASQAQPSSTRCDTSWVCPRCHRGVPLWWRATAQSDQGPCSHRLGACSHEPRPEGASGVAA
jgi:hypothetical protein